MAVVVVVIGTQAMLLVYLAVAWVSGIAAAARFALPSPVWVWWLVLPAGLLLIWRRDATLRQVHVCLLLFVLGALRYTAALPQFDAHSLAAWNDRGIQTLAGHVVDPPEQGDKWTNLRVQVERLGEGAAAQEITGLALVQVPRELEVRYGDAVRIYAEPETPFEGTDFSYKEWLARRGIHSLIRAPGASLRVTARDQGAPFFLALYALRDRGARTLRAIFPEPAAALVTGILLGDDSGMPRDLKDAFSATNTAHIIAISGFNIALVAGLLTQLTRRFKVGWPAIVVIPGVVLYTLLVGASASVVRAAIMAGLSVLARQWGRQNDGLNALALSAFVMTAWDPWVLFDLSFQLSFLATLGLVLYVEPITRWVDGLLRLWLPGDRAKQILGALNDSLIVTLAAQITSTPLIVAAFHRLSIVGLFSNLLVLPVQPAVEIWGGLALLAGLVVQPAGQVVAWVAWVFLEWTIRMVAWTATLPLASIPVGSFDTLWLMLYYAGVVIAPQVDWRTALARVRPYASPALAACLALVVVMWTWHVVETAPDGQTHIEFLDAGSAAVLVRTAGGTRVLIDGGANPSATLAALGERLPLWDRSLDLVVLTDNDEAHLAGLVATLERYAVRQIVQVAAPAKPSAAYTKWAEMIAAKRVPVHPAQPELAIGLARDLVLEIVALDAAESAAVVRLRAGSVTVLLAGSASADDQAALLASPADVAATILVPSRKLTPEFLQAVRPEFAVLFAGKTTREQPGAELLATLAETRVWRTDEGGTIEVVTDGRTLTVRTAR